MFTANESIQPTDRPGWDDVPPLFLSIAPFVRSCGQMICVGGHREEQKQRKVWRCGRILHLDKGNSSAPLDKGQREAAIEYTIFRWSGVMQIINVNKFLRQPARPQFRRVKRIEYREDGITQSVVRPSVCQLFGYRAKTREERGGGEGSSRGGVGFNAKC